MAEQSSQTSPLATESAKEKISIFSRLWIIPAYCWVLAFLPFFLKKRNDFVQFHAKQGVVLFITELILVFLSVIPIIGQLISLVGSVFCAYFSIRALIAGLLGRKWVLPWLGKFAQRMKSSC